MLDSVRQRVSLIDRNCVGNTIAAIHDNHRQAHPLVENTILRLKSFYLNGTADRFLEEFEKCQFEKKQGFRPSSQPPNVLETLEFSRR